MRRLYALSSGLFPASAVIVLAATACSHTPKTRVSEKGSARKGVFVL